MRRLLRVETSEPVLDGATRRNPKRKDLFNGIPLNLPRTGKGSHFGIGQCAECQGDVKVFVSPRRNPHSSKLGRAVSMKDHDLCRRCWRLLMHQQRHEKGEVLKLCMGRQGSKLHPRLLIPKLPSLPRAAS